MIKLPEYEPRGTCPHCKKSYDLADGFCCEPMMCDICGDEPATEEHEEYTVCESCLCELKEEEEDDEH